MSILANKPTLVYKRLGFKKDKIKTNFLFFRTLFKSQIDCFFYYRKTNFQDYKIINKSKTVVFNSAKIFNDLIALNLINNIKLLNYKDIKKQLKKPSKSKKQKAKAVVLYPSIALDKLNNQEKKQQKKKFLKKHLNSSDYKLAKKNAIIYFCAKNLKQCGFDKVLEILHNINKSLGVTFIISSSKDQLYYAKELSGINKNSSHIIFSTKSCFGFSDIFLLPTKNKNFASSVLDAIGCGCCVFIPKHNDASSILNEFSLMSNESDASVLHKIESLLINKQELKNEQEAHYKIAQKIEKSNKATIKYLKKLQ